MNFVVYKMTFIEFWPSYDGHIPFFVPGPAHIQQVKRTVVFSFSF